MTSDLWCSRSKATSDREPILDDIQALGEGGGSKVDPALVGQADQVDEHVGHLLGDASVQGFLT